MSPEPHAVMSPVVAARGIREGQHASNAFQLDVTPERRRAEPLERGEIRSPIALRPGRVASVGYCTSISKSYAEVDCTKLTNRRQGRVNSACSIVSMTSEIASWLAGRDAAVSRRGDGPAAAEVFKALANRTTYKGKYGRRPAIPE
jgi:hypothetical protein